MKGTIQQHVGEKSKSRGETCFVQPKGQQTPALYSIREIECGR